MYVGSAQHSKRASTFPSPFPFPFSRSIILHCSQHTLFSIPTHPVPFHSIHLMSRRREQSTMYVISSPQSHHHSIGKSYPFQNFVHEPDPQMQTSPQFIPLSSFMLPLEGRASCPTVARSLALTTGWDAREVLPKMKEDVVEMHRMSRFLLPHTRTRA